MSGKETHVLDIREILRHLQQGRSDREICRALKMSRKTVTKYREWAEQEGWLHGALPEPAEVQARLKRLKMETRPPRQMTSSVEPYRDIVVELRRQGVEMQALYQRLKERGYRGTYSSVWRFVRRLEPVVPEVTVRVETSPGEEAQIDFGYVGQMWDPQTQRLRRTWAFVMTLSWSRHQYVEFVFDQSVPTWLALHVQAFEFLKGVPRRIKLDNLKAAIPHADRDEPAVQRAYRDLAEHYGFLIDPCRVATPEHKGKVESGVHYVQRNFLGGRAFREGHADVRRANREVREWILTTAGLRCHGTTRQIPLERFEQVEAPALLPLPPVRFEEVTWKQVKVHRDCYVVFDHGFYSAPYRLVGETLWLRATTTRVELYQDFELVARHTRAVQAGQRQTENAHLPPEKLAGLTLTPDACRARAVQVGPHCQEVVDTLLAERPVDRLRAVHRLLNLAEKYTPEKLDRACRRALRYDDVSVRTIRRILESGLADRDDELVEEPVVEVGNWPRFARRPEELLPPHHPASEATPDERTQEA